MRYFLIKSSRGFTLIELLVIILLLGALSTMGIMRYKDANDSSKYSTSIATARSICDAQKSYYAIHRKFATSQNLVEEEFLDVNNKSWNGTTFLDGWGNEYNEVRDDENFTISLSEISANKINNNFEFSAP